MKRANTYSIKKVTVSLFLLLVISVPFNGYAHNHSENSMADNVEITNAWARATFALAKTGAAYMDIENTSDTSVHLISASVADDIASTTEIHHTIMTNDMMQMQELEKGVVIEAGEKANFVPGGKHIMLMGLTSPLNKGGSLDVKLTFSDGSTKTHTFDILDKRIPSDALHKHH